MDATDFFAVYFSHSWNDRDVAINLMLWEQLAGRCRLHIDKPLPTREAGRPLGRVRRLPVKRGSLASCANPRPA